MAGGRRNRGEYGARILSGARMWLEVGETGDCMVDAMYKEQVCGWRKTDDSMMDAMCKEPGCGWR